MSSSTTRLKFTHGIMCGHLVRTSNIQRYTDIQFSRAEIASSHLVSDSAVLVSDGRWDSSITSAWPASQPGRANSASRSHLDTISPSPLPRLKLAPQPPSWRHHHGGNLGPAAAGQPGDGARGRGGGQRTHRLRDWRLEREREAEGA